MRPIFNPLKYILLVAVSLLFLNSCNLKHEEDEGVNGEEKENIAFTIQQEFQQEFDRTKDPITNTVPRERLLAANEQVKQFFSKDNAITGISWVERGPSNVGGRTRAILFDKNDATNNTLFAGGVAGGIWKCTNLNNATPTWTKISDVLDNIAITTIVQDQVTPSIMYFGTGEVWGNSDSQRGLGIWKSTDGGATWNHLSSTLSSQFNYVQNIVLTSYAIFAATGAGLMKSTDGGNSWSTVLINKVSDVQLAANGDIYASDFLGNVYKSTNAQQGAIGTWANTALPGSHQRLKLALAPSDPNKVYVMCQGAGSNEVDKIYRSDDGGATWITCTLPTVTDQGSASTLARGQAWYDLAAAVDPNNASTVIIGAIDALRSTDGGATWNQITAWALPVTNFTLTVHSDQHIILFSPGSSSRAVWGCDGGIYYTSNVNVTPNTTKPTFSAINTGYDVTQFYGGAMNPTAGSTYFLAGAQDNGSQKFSGGGGIQSTTAASGGDGAFCHIDQTTPANQFTSYVYSVYYKSTNSGASFSNPISDQTHGLFINPTDYDPATKVLYGDYTTVSTATGGAYSRWLTTGTTNTGVTVANFGGASVTNVYVSPNVAKRVYFGLANGSVVYVNSANTAVSGTASTIIRTGIGSVSGIAIEPANENHILVTYSNYGVNSVWETTDGGTTWTSVEGNLPDMPVRWVIFNPANADQAFLATELGVWSTDNLNGTSTLWAPTNAGLANTRVDMLKVRTSDNTILAATHGRGLFTTTLANVVLPTVYFEKSNISVTQNGNANACAISNTTVPVNLYLTSAAASPVTVQVNALSGSTATNGKDYTIGSNSVTFPAGTTGPQTVNVSLNNDNSYTGTEYLNLGYSITSGGSAATVGNTLQNCTISILNTPLASAPTSGYVNIVNSGTANTSLGGSSPVQASQTDKKIQYLYSAADLLANGLKAGVITNISFVVTTKASTAPYNGFTFRVGPTTATDLSAGYATSSAWTIINSGNYSTTFGINQFTIAGGFTWDGTSNLLFDFCYDNSTATADDIVSGEATSYVSQAKKSNTVGTDAGCGYTTATAVNTYRPVFTFTQTIPQTTVSTALNSTAQAELGNNDLVYYFDASGNIIASIQNLLAFDYGCTSVTIDRAGTGATAFTDNTTADFLMNKTFHVIPTTNNTSGQYKITLYYTQAEKAGWEAATGNNWSNIMIIKTTNAISGATPGNPVGAGTIQYAAPVFGTFGSDYTLSYTFNNGFSGFGAGVPPASLALNLLNFSGIQSGNSVALNWSTSFEKNTSYYNIQRSVDGVNFQSVGTVYSALNSFTTNNYSFIDQTPGSINYYRLKIVDLDGNSTFSTVISIKIADGYQKVYLLNNPVSNMINVRFANPPTNEAILALYDISGKMLVTRGYKNPGNLIQLSLPQPKVSKGVYMLKVLVDGEEYTFKVVKN